MKAMLSPLRSLAFLLLLALAACGEPAPGAEGGQAARGEGPVILATTRNMPDWLLVARQRDCAPGGDCPRGEVHFNQRTITRNADGTADIWIQVRHGLPQLYEIDSETSETTVRFDVERLHYRFRCDSGEFIVVERQILGAGETIVARDQPRPIYRQPVRGSATGIIMPIACRGG
jgi:hypothetical protein